MVANSKTVILNSQLVFATLSEHNERVLSVDLLKIGKIGKPYLLLARLFIFKVR